MGGQMIDAIYSGGVLRPLGDVSLRESERVRLTIERQDPAAPGWQAALERLRAGISQMDFFLIDSPPSRDELHDRF